MPIKIYNTLTGKKETFKPIKKDKVGMYVCGVTVYDECHIGHVRGAFIFDIVRRYFEYKGYKVKYVRNITDVDDKIIEKARGEASKRQSVPDRQAIGAGTVSELKEKVKEIAERFTKSYYDDMKKLGVKKADIEPKATEHIEDMIKLIQKLSKNEYAYEKEGDVYFEVRKFKKYGRLSGQSLDDMRIGARVEVDEKKKDALDFALWKSSKENEPYWDSPWGHGRPGWHIECSTMSMKYLGENFDIHGGGRDLVFPHHENEIAQSECATGKHFANYWMHNGLLTINGQKMAKSLGNFISVKDIINKYHPEVLRIFFLSAHYRSPLDFTYERMEEAKRARERFIILFQKLDSLKVKSKKASLAFARDKKVKSKEIEGFRKRFEEAMDDDFNTAEALAVLFDLVTYVNREMQEARKEPVFLRKQVPMRYAKDILLELGGVLGLSFEEDTVSISKDIEDSIKFRDKLRKEKKFKEADQIRKELEEKGIILEDKKGGTTWRIR